MEPFEDSVAYFNDVSQAVPSALGDRENGYAYGSLQS